MSRRYDMGEQDTTLFSLPKIALITLNPKKTQLQNCLLVYLFWVTPETFGKCVKQGVTMNMFMFLKKVWIGNTLPPCPIEKCNIILVSLSLSKTGALWLLIYVVVWFYL